MATRDETVVGRRTVVKKNDGGKARPPHEEQRRATPATKATQPARNAQGQRGTNGPAAPPTRKSIDLSTLVDVHIRIGLDDEIVRVRKDDYKEKFYRTWILSGDDIVLRAVFNNHERNILLRGNDSGCLDISEADPNRKIPVYNVYKTRDLMQAEIAKFEKLREANANEKKAE